MDNKGKNDAAKVITIMGVTLLAVIILKNRASAEPPEEPEYNVDIELEEG